MIKGIYSQYVRMRVIEADIKNEADLLQFMVGAVANALQAFTLDMGGIANLDGLATTTNFETQPEYGIDNFDKEEPMEIGKVEDNKCFFCNKKGHYAREY